MPDPLSFAEFRGRYGDLWLPWSEGDWWILRWAMAIVALATALAFVRAIDFGIDIGWVNVPIMLGAIAVIVVMGRITPRGGGLRIDGTGVRVMPKGPHLAPEDIRDVTVVPHPAGGLTLLIHTRATHRFVLPFRATMSGHRSRLRLPADFADRTAL
ncbi:hypothetical protein [Jannaschia rubra]|uniref:hypothetical protein n=1 Tax=Jannaschia rubra TaxID=282197 RepID=UPI00249341F0|nr:hypothetical protein [Jannaschia rubra]